MAPAHRRFHIGLVVVCLVATVLGLPPVHARMALHSELVKETRPGTAASPVRCLAAHRVGQLELAVTNAGTFGREYHQAEMIDWFTGQPIAQSCFYPKGSNITYLFGGTFWIGAVVGRDTLVSVGADGWQWVYEMNPDEPPFGEMKYRSIMNPSAAEYVGAVSEEDYVSIYTDTVTDNIPNDYFGRPHIPLNIEITEASYAWSYAYAEDFVLFDYQIRNIGARTIEAVYMGVFVDCMVGEDPLSHPERYQDDQAGFLHTWPSEYGDCTYLDTVFIAWSADNDGDLIPDPSGASHPCPHVTGTRIVRTPSDSLDVSFNWWIGHSNPALDFAPREKSGVGRRKDEFRDFGTGGLAIPEGDANKYYVMSNLEFDYDQCYTAVMSPSDSLWMLPDQGRAGDFANGFDIKYLLSFGPFTINPGQTLPVSFAYVAGENLHTQPHNAELHMPHDPDAYKANLDYSDLALNARWAAWVYDNPGVDSDSDGYFGKYRLCGATDSVIAVIDTISIAPLQTDTIWSFAGADTFWYEGDGVPDFRGAAPPPAPAFWVSSSVGSLGVRINGLRSETTPDVFSRKIDFEGYRIYVGRDDRPGSFSVVASYDREDYNRWVYNASLRPTPGYELIETPFTIEQLRCLYGDSCGDTLFYPLLYTREHPLVIDGPAPGDPDQIMYFEPQDFNCSQFGVSSSLRKSYPDMPYPSSLIPDSANPDELTDDGYLKYFEYEFQIDNLLPSVPYWVNVTAFDFGSPESDLGSLETSVSVGAQMKYALSSWDEIQRGDLGVIVYPNPYRSDADYRDWGYEGRQESLKPPDRTRAIMFVNVPPVCTIRIYSLDGDLVREIPHSDGSNQASWDLITRNTQQVVSGLYYWTVEGPSGDVEIGKLVIIM